MMVLTMIADGGIMLMIVNKWVGAPGVFTTSYNEFEWIDTHVSVCVKAFMLIKTSVITYKNTQYADL